jgi:hypothetical protein
MCFFGCFIDRFLLHFTGYYVDFFIIHSIGAGNSLPGFCLDVTWLLRG